MLRTLVFLVLIAAAAFRRTLVSMAACLLVASLPVAAAQQKDEPVYKPGDGVSLPRVVKDVKPVYTPKALSARVQGTVWLDCVVSSDGTTRNIEVAQSLHEELDAQAVAALEQWQFKPGTKDGTPVAVQIKVEMTFTLK